MSCALTGKNRHKQNHRPLAPGGERPQNGADKASPLRFLRRGCGAEAQVIYQAREFLSLHQQPLAMR